MKMMEKARKQKVKNDLKRCSKLNTRVRQLEGEQEVYLTPMSSPLRRQAPPTSRVQPISPILPISTNPFLQNDSNSRQLFDYEETLGAVGGKTNENEQTNEQTNGQTNEQTNGQTNEQTNGQRNDQTNERRNARINEQIDYVYRRLDERMDLINSQIQINEQTIEQANKKVNKQTNKQINEQTIEQSNKKATKQINEQTKETKTAEINETNEKMKETKETNEQTNEQKQTNEENNQTGTKKKSIKPKAPQIPTRINPKREAKKQINYYK